MDLLLVEARKNGGRYTPEALLQQHPELGMDIICEAIRTLDKRGLVTAKYYVLTDLNSSASTANTRPVKRYEIRGLRIPPRARFFPFYDEEAAIRCIGWLNQHLSPPLGACHKTIACYGNRCGFLNIQYDSSSLSLTCTLRWRWVSILPFAHGRILGKAAATFYILSVGMVRGILIFPS